MYTVQLPYLRNIQPEHYENEPFKEKLYTFLKLFDQARHRQDNVHKLLLLRREFSEDQFRRIIQRLKSALAEFPMLEEQMHVEDEYLEEWREHKNTIAFLQTQIEEQQDEINEKNQQIEQQNQLLEDQKEAIRQYARMLDQMGKSTEEIQQLTNLSPEEIERL